MVKRFEILLPHETETEQETDNNMAMAENVKLQTAKWIRQMEAVVIRRPVVILPAAVLTGMVIGWLVKRR